MAIIVETVRDIIDPSSGSVLVPEGSVGDVVSASNPSDPVYLVNFTVGQNIVQSSVSDPDIRWEDGDLGPVRAFYEGKTVTISEIKQAEPVLDFERSLGPSDLSFRIKFDDGSVITMRPDRNTGRISFTLS